MKHDGPKRFGRFLKKDSTVLKRVALTEFSFEEICVSPAIAHDNQSRSIIHNKYHDRDFIDETVKAPETFDNDLQNEHLRRPVLRPLDFTRDWERDKKMRKVRSSRQGDDDVDFELEYEEAYQNSLRDSEANRDGDGKNSEKSGGEGQQASKPAGTSPVKPADTPTDSPRYDSMEVVGKAIKNLMHLDDAVGLADQPLTASVPKLTTPVSQGSKPSASMPTPAAEKLERSNDFIPTGGSNASEVDPEEEAARLYQQRLAEEKLTAERIEQRVAAAVEEAKSKGYRDGYILGEEKAELQARQKAAAMFGKVGELVQEFSHLKLDILNNVQENFYELCQAMAEALLKREFSIKPEAFATVLRRAIGEAIAPGEFKIKVHPEMYDRIAALGDQELTKALAKDVDMPLGDFKIESDLSVVDGQVGKLIKDLLSQADLNIFDSADIDVSGKKAG